MRRGYLVTFLNESLAPFVLGLLWTGACLAAPGTDSVATLAPGRIEADWLRQDAVRPIPAFNASTPVTPAEDAAGACDGVRTGEWGFHTAREIGRAHV